MRQRARSSRRLAPADCDRLLRRTAVRTRRDRAPDSCPSRGLSRHLATHQRPSAANELLDRDRTHEMLPAQLSPRLRVEHASLPDSITETKPGPTDPRTQGVRFRPAEGVSLPPTPIGSKSGRGCPARCARTGYRGHLRQPARLCCRRGTRLVWCFTSTVGAAVGGRGRADVARQVESQVGGGAQARARGHLVDGEGGRLQQASGLEQTLRG